LRHVRDGAPVSVYYQSRACVAAGLRNAHCWVILKRDKRSIEWTKQQLQPRVKALLHEARGGNMEGHSPYGTRRFLATQHYY
jgi:hypothetical protein